MKRLFCAVKIAADDTIRETIGHFQQSLADERIKWVNPEILHLTLHFFGDTHSGSEEKIIQALRDAARRVEPFCIDVSGCGSFGPKRAPRVVWLGIRNAESLVQLHSKVQKRLQPLGLDTGKQPYVPHLTIGRIKGPVNQDVFVHLLKKYSDKHFSRQQIESMVLYQSILHKDGPEYRPVEIFTLQARNDEKSS